MAASAFYDNRDCVAADMYRDSHTASPPFPGGSASRPVFPMCPGRLCGLFYCTSPGVLCKHLPLQKSLCNTKQSPWVLHTGVHRSKIFLRPEKAARLNTRRAAGLTGAYRFLLLLTFIFGKSCTGGGGGEGGGGLGWCFWSTK